MAFCSACNREVGATKEGPSAAFWVLFWLGLLVPAWLITLPLFWIAAVCIYRVRYFCGICRSKLTRDELVRGEKPVEVREPVTFIGGPRRKSEKDDVFGG
jgi:hypothetical protein